ncbi:uncharacterized protein LOC134229802 isoform X2 [Saccostrea cucullata]|uniref:uncharacterized protein LOC134229802 isoform X2 n=1 Tax=Saccostrea cuccullata TaxID=36930 RepID=UPI002ED28C95
MRVLWLLSMALVFSLAMSEENCFGNTCEECMRNSESGRCIWCGAANFTSGPRCMYIRNFEQRGKCPGSLVHWPTKLTYIKSRGFSDSVIMGNDINKYAGRKGGVAEHRIAVRVPDTVSRKKKVTAVVLLPRPGNDDPVLITVDVECSKRFVSKKNPYKVKCKKLKRGEEFYMKVMVKFLKDMKPKEKKKLKLRVKIGKLKQVLRIFASGIEPCRCSTKRTNAPICKWKDSKGSKGNSKCVCTDADRPTTTEVPVAVESPVIRPVGGGMPIGAAGGGMGTRFTIPEESLNRLPLGSPAEDIECQNCKDQCPDHGKCVDCFVFSGSPMPNAMCRQFCGGRRFAPTFRRVRGFPDDVNKCTYRDEQGCLMKFQIVHDRFFEVSMKKDCPTEICPQNATCASDSSGNICSNNGVCKCGVCECNPGYYGQSCEQCQNCGGKCNELKSCVACTSFNDFSGYKDERECSDNCASYNIRPMSPFLSPRSVTNSKMCQVFNKNNCFYTFAYTTTGNDVTEVSVLQQQVCPEYNGN